TCALPILQLFFSYLFLFALSHPSLRRGPSGLKVFIGSACRLTSFHSPSSSRKVVVTRKSKVDISSLPPIFTCDCSCSIRVTSSGDSYFAIISVLICLPSLNRVA